ncbi:MAG: reverse transcriptase domain-containing protein, partial [Pseudomonadota bacterium]
LEDKVLQRAVLMVLEPIFEQDFLDCSYGFRPGRSAHQALEALRGGLMALGGGWIIDLDIRSYFDSIGHSHLRHFLEQRVRDGVIGRAVGKWLNAGVMEDGAVSCAEKGTPQGGVISPWLSNLYLHEVLDLWFERDVKPRLRGRAFMVRYADDAVLVFEREEDARRVRDVLPKRFGKYGLELHPEKTRLVAFRRPDRSGGTPPACFDLLGFTHFWGRSRKGRWMVSRKTARGRFGAALQRVAQWCRVHRHRSLPEQHETLSRKLQGHYAYYGITGNSRALGRFRYEVARRWRYWLSRRSAAGKLSWEAFNRLLTRYPLPNVRVVHRVYRSATIP